MGFLKKIFLGFLILGATACTSLWDSDIGRPIKFGIAPNASTRASYVDIAGGEIDWDTGDQVGIYMFWNGPGDQPRNAVYNVLPIGGAENYGKLSIDSRTSVSLTWQGYFKDGRAVEYEHTFISSHPPRDLVDGGFVFELPEKQNGTTEHLFLTCYEEGIQSGTRENGDVVFLHYYPAVTTLVITVEDDADKLPTKSGTLTLFSEENNLAGSFKVYPGDQTVVEILDGKPSVEVPFVVGKPTMMFLIPVQHPPNELSFSLNGSDKKVIANALEPFVKYIATISPPDGLSVGACQFIYAAMKPGLQELFRSLLGNDFVNNKIDKMPKPVTVEAFYKMFTEAEIQTILEVMSQASEISISYDSGITESISASDMQKLIPSCQILTLRVERDVTISFKDMPLLQTIHVEGNGKVIIYADGCGDITTTWWDSQKNNGSGIYINGEWHKAQ